MKRAMNILSKVMYGVSFFFLIAVASFFLLPHVPGVGALDVKIVKSGSMEPNVMTGGIVFIREIPSYTIGDIITFQTVGADIPTTHRIIGTELFNGKTHFVTKGDANEERDTDLVSPSMIHGKMLLTVPNIGFVFDFARQPMGFMFLIALPALLIVFDELEKIWKEYRRIRIKRRAEMKPAPLVIAPFVQEPIEPRMIDINSPVAILETRVATNVKSIPIVRREMSPAHGARERGWILASCFVLAFSSLVVGLGSFGQTVSYFSDIERALANEFRAVALGFTATPDDDLFSFVDGVLDDADGAVITNVIPESGSTNLKYSLTTEFIDGNQALCKSIVGTSVNPPFAYIGPLTLGSLQQTYCSPTHGRLELRSTHRRRMAQVTRVCLILYTLDGTGIFRKEMEGMSTQKKFD
jgi:signal peptidase I